MTDGSTGWGCDRTPGGTGGGVTGGAAAHGVVPASICVLRYALQRHAATKGDTTYAVFADGERWSFRNTLAKARAVAAGLQALGVRQGDRVLVMLPNGADAIRALTGVCYLGAVFVPVNTAYRGAILAHVLQDSGASLAIVHPDCAARVLDAAPDGLRTIVVAGDVAMSRSARVVDGAALDGDASRLAPPEQPIAPWDLQSVIYTSGTTGRSKGVLSSYMHGYTACSTQSWQCLRPDDRQMLHMPIFHIGGTFVASAALCMGGSIAVVPGFKSDLFWDQVRALEVTSVFLLGAMATFLLKRAPQPGDRDHALRHVMIVPLGRSGPTFRARFGVDVYTLFNMTEISTPLMSAANPTKPNVCGRPRAGVEVRLADAHDVPVPVGQPGELLVRTDAPWAMSHGYNGNPEATASAWRNGWFHTGDVFIQDAEGDFSFVDRLKDTIRRRGENISSFDVELELLSHPAVREAAAVAVPSEHTESEVLAVLAPQPGAVIDPAELLDYLRDRLPPFMLPRYVRVVEDLPKTPTAKIEKHLLRQEGCAPGTWDREANRATRGRA